MLLVFSVYGQVYENKNISFVSLCNLICLLILPLPSTAKFKSFANFTPKRIFKRL